MSEKQGWLPLAELPSAEGITWRANDDLPDYLSTSAQNILVNPDHVGALARLGGFQPTVTVIGGQLRQNEGRPPEKSQTQAPANTGINADGSAMAGRPRKVKPKRRQIRA